MAREDLPARKPVVSRGLPGVGVSVRHHLPLIAASVILAMSLAAFYVVTLASSYTSSAVVLLSPAPGNPLTAETASSSGVQLTIAMETEEQLVSTAAVRSAVSESVGREIPDEGERLEVTVRPNTQMLEIAFTSDTPETAQRGAEAFAQGYLDYREEQAQNIQDDRITALQSQMEEADASLRRAVGEAAQSDTSSYASQEVQLHAARLAQLTTALSTTQSVSTAPGSVLDPPETPQSANEIPAWMVFVAAGLGGLAFGVLMAMLREWRRGLVRAGESVDLGLPVFANIVAGRSGGLAAAEGGAAHEAYRRLRAAVIANAPVPHVLAVSPVGDEDSMVAADLAVILAEARLSVLLVGTNPEGMAASRALGLAERPGVAEVVGGEADAASLITRSHGVSVLTPGLASADVRDLAATPAFRHLIDQMRSRFDYVVLEGVPAAGEEMLLVADSVLLVLTQDQTVRAQVTATLERLDHLGVKALGAVRVQKSHRAEPPAAAAAATDTSADVITDQAEFRAPA